MADKPYSRVYHSIVDDPMFERVFSNDKALATWLRMLLVADAMYPVSAPMPRRNPTVSLLLDVGLVQMRGANRYTIRGLEAERERRSHIGRNAAAARYGLPRRDETRRDGVSATPRTNGWSHDYQPAPGEALVVRHEGQHPDCLVCAPMRGTA